MTGLGCGAGAQGGPPGCSVPAWQQSEPWGPAPAERAVGVGDSCGALRATRRPRCGPGGVGRLEAGAQAAAPARPFQRLPRLSRKGGCGAVAATSSFLSPCCLLSAIGTFTLLRRLSEQAFVHVALPPASFWGCLSAVGTSRRHR